MPNKSQKLAESSNVSNSLMPRIEKKKADALSTPDFTVLDPKRLFGIPWKDITVCKDGAANPSKENLIYIGPDALAALNRLYAEFGVTGLPTTWGQLMGSVAYCQELNGASNFPRLGAKADAEWFEAVLSVAQKYTPDLVPAINAYHEGNLELLKAEFVKNIGFDLCAWHFDPMTGWDCYPDSLPPKLQR